MESLYNEKQQYRKLTFAELSKAHPTLKELSRVPALPVCVVLDDIRSLYNVGAIFRTSDAVHLEKIYLCGISGRPPRSEIRKTSLGAEESVEWVYNKDAREVVRDLRQKGYQIVALEHTDNSQDYRTAAYLFPLCLIVGHEYHGIADKLLEEADLAVEIPMRGIKLSLNVSVAFGVTIYHILSQWEHKHTVEC